MTDDRSRGAGTDPTLTPTQAAGVAPTNVSSDAPPARPSAAQLPARYVLKRQLGAGGMGEVVLATDGQIGRDVAIKRMRIEATDAAVARFVREAKIQGRLDHPAIVPVHELANDADGRPFFVMKRLTGTTLADILAGGGTQTRQKLLRAFADVCLAIEFAHERGVIHRDLKPANIMLGDFGEVYVLDWGVARIAGEADDVAGEAIVGAAEDDTARTEAGAILGTPGYIAPELLRGEPIDARADVYALGCILFEILTGTPLLPRGRDALNAALAPIETRPSQRAPDRDVPPELDELCVAATTTTGAQRPTARELAERIERYLDGDRDVALRKTLAVAHMAAARAALAGGNGEAERATAMREAGRAIALDPRGSGAADLVGRLMLEPPREVPREVEARVTLMQQATARKKVKLMTRSLLAFLFVIPASYAIGVRSHLALVAFGAVVAINLALTNYFAYRKAPPSRAGVLISATVFTLVVLVLSRTFTPFLLAPAIAGISVVLFAVDTRVSWLVIAALNGIGVLGPWLAEVAGLVPHTIKNVGGDMVLHSEAIISTYPAAEIGLAFFVIATLGAAGFLANQLGRQQSDAFRSLELQAWHLRQLVAS